MSEWWKAPLVGFDMETTSVNPLVAQPVSFAFIFDDPHGMRLSDTRLVKPDIEIPEESSQIHGIRAADVEQSEELDEALRYIIGKLRRLTGEGYPIVGMNLSYDLTILDQQAFRLGIDGLQDWAGPVLDIFVLDKQVDRYRKGGRKLTDLVQHYGVDAPGEAHRAVWDAAASVAVARAMAGRYKAIGHRTARQLHEHQIGWRREQQQSFSEYVVEKKGGKPLDEREFVWPVYPR
jgi:DNA polymerase-3 subunit epsilon